MIKFNYKLAGGIGSFGETKNFYKGNQCTYHTKWPGIGSLILWRNEMTTMTINKKDYSCKKMKEMEGHDGYVIRFDLCYKGKKVAEVYDDGNGGMIEFEWKKYNIS